MLFADSSELVQVVTLVLAFLSTVFTGGMAYLIAKLNAKQAEAAVKVAEVAEKQDAAAIEVQEVKTTLATTASKQDAKLDEIHKLTNSMKDELVAEVRKSSRAEGVQSERDKSHGNGT